MDGVINEIAAAKDREACFLLCQERAAMYWPGHGMALKRDCVTLLDGRQLSMDDAYILARKMILADDPRFAETRGPVGAIRLTLSSVYPGSDDRSGDGEAWFFFGWAEVFDEGLGDDQLTPKSPEGFEILNELENRTGMSPSKTFDDSTRLYRNANIAFTPELDYINPDWRKHINIFRTFRG